MSTPPIHSIERWKEFLAGESTVQGGGMADIRDVFISYVQADHIRVEMPAQNLHQLRPEMCFDERNTSPRSIFIHRRDDDNRTAKDSIAISPATLNTRFWIKQCTSAF